MEKKKLKEEILDISKQILEVLKQPKLGIVEKRTFSVAEAASYSGIGQEKIRELIYKQNTDFPFFKVGSRAAIDKKLFDEWLEKISEEHRKL